MENRFFKKHELQDKEIIEVLNQCAKDYENGEIVEVQDTLRDVIEAINLFSKEN